MNSNAWQVSNTETTPAYTQQLILAFKEIGIDVLCGDGSGISNPAEVKVYVGAK